MSSLGLVDDSYVTRTQHVQAGVVGFEISYLAPRVFDNCFGARAVLIGHTTQLAEVIKTWSNNSKKNSVLSI